MLSTLTEVCEESEYIGSYREHHPRKKSRAWYARQKKDVVDAREATEPNAEVDTREANTSRSGNVNINGKDCVNRTGNMHVSITIPEVRRQGAKQNYQMVQSQTPLVVAGVQTALRAATRHQAKAREEAGSQSQRKAKAVLDLSGQTETDQ